ncbi:hypothetical protein MHU86_11701 [Fragilaria crotonensis]|nr:hypothetical protein MHU86_11701 [Fragilaria crotonensis]
MLVIFGLATNAMATCLHTFQNCGAGCYNKDNLVLNGGLHICSPVGAGYFSPRNDNARYECESGSYSNHDEAEFCSICDAGSISGVGFRDCFLCPSGFYQELPGQANCKECAPGYDGDGANDFAYDSMTNTLYCELTGVEPSMVPSLSPSNSPTLRASSTPSQEPSRHPSASPSRNSSAKPSQKPSRHPSLSPSRKPSAAPTIARSGAPSMAPSLRRRRATVPASALVATVSLVVVFLGAFAFKICMQRREMRAKEIAELHEAARDMSGDDLEDGAFVQAVLQQHQPAKVDEKCSKKQTTDVIVILDAVAVEVNDAEDTII